MTPLELQEYLCDRIPLYRAMQASVVDVQYEGVVLSAPLAPNINHRQTVFGGSASAVAIVAAWSLLHVRLSSLAIPSRVVIQRNTMHYDLPITGPFMARSSVTHPDAWDSFIRTLNRKGRARTSVSAVLEQSGKLAGRLEGDFVALGHAADQRT